MNARKDLHLDPPVYVKDLPDDDPMRIAVKRSEQLLAKWRAGFVKREAADRRKLEEMTSGRKQLDLLG